MSSVNSAFSRDGNFVPITNLGLITKKTITFDGGTANDPGDFDGTGNPATLFTVTGGVLLNVVAICKADLVGAATLEVGVIGGTDGVIAQISDASTVTAPKIWFGSLAALTGEFDNNGTMYKVIGGGQDIIQTIGTTDINAGVIDYYCIWNPLSDDGNVVAA